MHTKSKNIKKYCEVFMRKGSRDAPPPSQEYDYLQRRMVFCREVDNPPPQSRSLIVYYRAKRNVMDHRYAYDPRYLTFQSRCLEPNTAVVHDVVYEKPCLTTHITIEEPVSSESRLSLNRCPNYLCQSIVLPGHLYEGGSS
jgi:hypothetical protein